MTHRFHRRLIAMAAISLLAAACGGTDSSDVEIRIVGADMGPRQQTVIITQGGQSVDDATITVNGFNLGSTGGGSYTGQLPTALPVNGVLNLTVEVGSATITAQGTVPHPASVETLLPDVDASAALALQVEWLSQLDPDFFILSAECGGCTTDFTSTRPGNERAFDIPPNSLEAGNTYAISVTGYRRGSFSGPADEQSSMNIANAGAGQSVNVIP